MSARMPVREQLACLVASPRFGASRANLVAICRKALVGEYRVVHIACPSVALSSRSDIPANPARTCELSGGLRFRDHRSEAGV